MKLLIVGYSSIVQKKALPALAGLKAFSSIDVVSQTRYEDAKKDGFISGTIYKNYEEAFDQTEASLVYVSTVNSTHASLAEKALLKGKHVVVDKPSFLQKEDVIRLLKLAKENHLCLAEAIIYKEHPQILKIKEVYRNLETQPDRISVSFSFPPYSDKSGYRYSKELGGGAIYDIGPYAISVGRLFFNNPVKRINGVITHFDEDCGIETSFSLLMEYEKGQTLVGHFGYDSQYDTRITFFGEKVNAHFSMPFSPPKQLENEIHLNIEDEKSVVKVSSGDNFGIFFEGVVDAIRSNNFSAYWSDLRIQFEELSMLRKHLLEE